MKGQKNLKGAKKRKRIKDTRKEKRKEKRKDTKKEKRKEKRTRRRARGPEDSAAKKIQRVQTRRVQARSKERQAYKDRFSRKVKVLRALEEKTEQYAPELIDKIFEAENFQNSPSPDMYDIPLQENATKINKDFGFFSTMPEFIRAWFGVHSVIHNERVLGKHITKRAAQIKFALHNRQMKTYLRKVIGDGGLGQRNMDILFPNNGEYAFKNNPWYVIYAILDNIEDALADQDYEAVHYYLSALNPSPPDLLELSTHMDTYFDIDELEEFVGYLMKKIEEKQWELMPEAYR
jgi:hypothetical protein